MNNSLAGNNQLDHEDVLAECKSRLCRRNSIRSCSFGIVEDGDHIQELRGDQDVGAVAIVMEHWLGVVEGRWSAGLVIGEFGEGVQLRGGVDDGWRLHG